MIHVFLSPISPDNEELTVICLGFCLDSPLRLLPLLLLIEIRSKKWNALFCSCVYMSEMSK